MLRNVVFGAVLSAALFGCAGQPRPIQTAAALGKVVVYRNGVAYFERTARVTNGQLRLTVPAERVDDFLKSLKVVDAHTGESLPVSFKTMISDTGESEMIIAVPGAGARDLQVSYVTDSPSWKPSYRVVLGKKPGNAEIEAWAVVDNVSGEDWNRVTIGVGSTSALSFRYDLHSVRMVERETLGGDELLAHAPPMGGSPYAVASAEIPVVGALSQSALDRLVNGPAAPNKTTAEVTRGVFPGAASAKPKGGSRSSEPDEEVAYAAGFRPPAAPPPADDRALDILAAQIRRQPGNVKLQGFARSNDEDKKDSGLRRANAVRDRLIERGVPADKLEAMAGDGVNDAQAVRVVGDAPASGPQQAQRTAEESKDPIGNAYFVAGVPMTIEKDRSAMVSLLKKDTSAERVYYYDPISSRGSQEFAFQAIRLENPSNYTLDRGPFTVYAEGQFLGEGLSEPIPPKSTAFIPFALDRTLVVEPKATDRDEIRRLVTIDRGVIAAEVQHIRKTTFSLHNRGTAEAKVYVRHAVAPGWELAPSKLPLEKLDGSYLFPVVVPARGAVEVSLEESQPVQQTVDIRTPAGAESVGLYLRQAADLSPKLRTQLEEVLALYREMADVEQKISTVADQMNEYRTRVDELNAQLVTLRKVTAAQELSRQLAKKMQEISDRLQKSTLRAADLKEELMTRRIKVQDRLADLTLRPGAAEERVAENPATTKTKAN